MQKQIQVNLEHLYKLAKSGKSAREIMAELDMRDMAGLKNAITELIRQRGEHITVPGLSDSSSATLRYTDDGIRISPDMIPGCEFKAGETLRLTVHGDKITLERQS